MPLGKLRILKRICVTACSERDMSATNSDEWSSRRGICWFWAGHHGRLV